MRINLEYIGCRIAEDASQRGAVAVAMAAVAVAAVAVVGLWRWVAVAWRVPHGKRFVLKNTNRVNHAKAGPRTAVSSASPASSSCFLRPPHPLRLFRHPLLCSCTENYLQGLCCARYSFLTPGSERLVSEHGYARAMIYAIA